ncbi:BPSL0761 family protein [Paraburkholderia caribensis]|uniref:BPSL0761 family protein n=1 Tax=Paraburkholderia caribensis TaxID=75105 RepID=UPI0029CA9C80|nr:BPSL0761 family protein [Paraburkholderia caribensis]
MTTPYERTKAVLDTREFLQMLANEEEISVEGLVRSVAVCLLRHYPLDIDLSNSALALPGLWSTPERRRQRLHIVRGAGDRLP